MQNTIIGTRKLHRFVNNHAAAVTNAISINDQLHFTTSAKGFPVDPYTALNIGFPHSQVPVCGKSVPAVSSNTSPTMLQTNTRLSFDCRKYFCLSSQLISVK